MPNFTVIDEEFECEHCKKHVPKLGYSCRNHCPYCLYSKHVDINPGDRENKCHGLLEPIAVEKYRDTYKIIYKCQKCGEIHKNILHKDDDFTKIVELSVIK